MIPLEKAEEGTDRHAIEQGYVSITPLRLDITDHEELVKLKSECSFDSVTFGSIS